MLLDILKELSEIKFLFNFLGIKFQPDGELDDVELDAELGALNHGLPYKWTELLYLTCPHEADLLTLIMSQKPTQYL